jgi:hypothetical protein
VNGYVWMVDSGPVGPYIGLFLWVDLDPLIFFSSFGPLKTGQFVWLQLSWQTLYANQISLHPRAATPSPHPLPLLPSADEELECTGSSLPPDEKLTWRRPCSRSGPPLPTRSLLRSPLAHPADENHRPALLPLRCSSANEELASAPSHAADENTQRYNRIAQQPPAWPPSHVTWVIWRTFKRTRCHLEVGVNRCF